MNTLEHRMDKRTLESAHKMALIDSKGYNMRAPDRVPNNNLLTLPSEKLADTLIVSDWFSLPSWQSVLDWFGSLTNQRDYMEKIVETLDAVKIKDTPAATSEFTPEEIKQMEDVVDFISHIKGDNKATVASFKAMKELLTRMKEKLKNKTNNMASQEAKALKNNKMTHALNGNGDSVSAQFAAALESLAQSDMPSVPNMEPTTTAVEVASITANVPTVQGQIVES